MENSKFSRLFGLFLFFYRAQLVRQQAQTNDRLNEMMQIEKQNELNARTNQMRLTQNEKNSRLDEFMNAHNQRLNNSHLSQFISPSVEQFGANRPKAVSICLKFILFLFFYKNKPLKKISDNCNYTEPFSLLQTPKTPITSMSTTQSTTILTTPTLIQKHSIAKFQSPSIPLLKFDFSSNLSKFQMSQNSRNKHYFLY